LTNFTEFNQTPCIQTLDRLNQEIMTYKDAHDLDNMN